LSLNWLDKPSFGAILAVWLACWFCHIWSLEKKEEIEDILEKNNYIVYICGLKGMEDPISIFFKRFFENKYKINFTEEEWNHFAKQLEKQHRLIVETY